jgi:L-iditol 2-dehydrogenase
MTSTSMWTYAVTAPYTFTQREVPAPLASDLLDGEVLLRIMVGGICGSDLPYFKGNVAPFSQPNEDGRMHSMHGAPLHELVGEVLSSRDPSLEPGQVVVGWATRLNAISEYLVVSGSDVRPFGTDLSPSVAIMLQPLACVIYGVDYINKVEGATAAVIGQGPIGILFSHVLKHRGASKVIGIDRVDRSDVGEIFGVDEVVWSTSAHWAAQPLPEAERPSVIVEAVGHQVGTLVDAVNMLQTDGQIYYFGIPDDQIYPLPMMTFLRKNATLTSGTTQSHARRGALARAEEYLRQYPDLAKQYISRTFNFSEIGEAFTVAAEPSVGRLKVTLEV